MEYLIKIGSGIFILVTSIFFESSLISIILLPWFETGEVSIEEGLLESSLFFGKIDSWIFWTSIALYL